MIRIESKGLIEANFFFAFWFGIVVTTTYLLSQIVGGDRPDAETVMRGCIYIAVNLILWIVSFRVPDRGSVNPSPLGDGQLAL